MVIRGQRKLVSLYAPVLAAGIGNFLAPTQKSRTFILEMEQYTAETKPEREFYADDDTSDLDEVYRFPVTGLPERSSIASRRCRRGYSVATPIMYAGCFRSLIPAVRNGGTALARR
jgi:hypothetical protein